jgi:hypothetical protein
MLLLNCSLLKREWTLMNALRVLASIVSRRTIDIILPVKY